MDVTSYGRQYAHFLSQMAWLSYCRPLRFTYPLAGQLARTFSPHRQAELQVKHNIHRCLGEEFVQTGWRNFLNHTGVANLNIFLIRRFTAAWLHHHIQIISKVDVAAALAQKRGLFVMTYHNHHPFLFTVAMGLFGQRIRTFAMDPKDNPVYPYISDIYDQYFADCEQHYQGGNFILVGEKTSLSAMRSVGQALKTGQIVISLNDVYSPYAAKRTMDLPFFHHQLACPVGTVEMALRHRSVITAGWLRWIRGDQFQLQLYPLSTENGVKGVMQQYVGLLQQLVVEDAGLWEGWKFFHF